MVSAGRGTGQVAIVRKREDLETLPDTALILAMPHSLVDAAQILPKVQGILVEFGNPTDHLSCVAREYGLPMLTGLSGATDRLSPGAWITLDPEAGRVFEAQEAEKEEALARRAALAQAAPQPSHPVPEALRPLWTRAVKLNLTDAYGPTFSMQECQSLHDIVRFIHEKAVLGMFELNDEVLERASGAVFRLEYDGPFFFYIIDLGGGLLPGRPARGSVIRPGDVYSVPFKALWRGLSTPGLRGTSPAGQGSMAPVVSRWMVDQRSGRPLGLPNYIILTRDYMNLNARLDFHFTMIDALCGLEARSNYIKFRFKGGGTSPAKRNRRARFLAEVLEADGFYTDLQNDLVNATFMGAPGPVIEEKLVNLGRLMDFSRLLDMVMTDDEAPRRLAEAFWAGNYRLEGLMAPTAPPGDQA